MKPECYNDLDNYNDLEALQWWFTANHMLLISGFKKSLFFSFINTLNNLYVYELKLS